MKIEIEITPAPSGGGRHFINSNFYAVAYFMTLDQIEDLEINLTDIIKQLQDYRMGFK